GLGNPVVVGRTTSTNFPVANALQTTNGGSQDAFVTRLCPAGCGAPFSTYLGGVGDDAANAVAVDSQGSIYLTGATTSTNFPTQTPARGSNAGGQDAFVSKLSGALPPPLLPSFGDPAERLQTPAGAQGGDPMAAAFSEAGVRYADGLIR